MDWEDALDALAATGERERLLVVLDEFPELVELTPELPRMLRAWWTHVQGDTKVKLVVCGSSLRTMEAMQEERAPLFGRFDLSLLVHPFRPHETALMLEHLDPADRAAVWALLGGMPYYLAQWDQRASFRTNLGRLVTDPGGLLLNEGRWLLTSDADTGALGGATLRAIAAGRTKYTEIKDAVGAEPARTLERLIELRLVERLVPVTEDPARTRRRTYRIADNFLAFSLSVVEPFRAEIERGLGRSILGALLDALDDFSGPRWEGAFRDHLRLMATEGVLAPDVVAVGPWWSGAGDDEIDAVVLAGRRRTPVLAGEAKWAKVVDGKRVLAELRRKAAGLPGAAPDLRFALAARGSVRDRGDAIVITAEDIFG